MQKRRILIVLLAIGILVIWKQLHQPEETPLQFLTGTTMGPIHYEVKYLHENNYQKEIDSILNGFNESLSTYIPNSELSKLNREGKIKYRSPYLYSVLTLSKEVFENSDGAFDPTVGPLVNAWGFGKDKKLRMDSTYIDSLLQFVGFDRVSFNNQGVEIPQGFYLDFSASAKGYAVDLVVEFLRSNQIKNYMVEIGGEVACQGKNEREKTWLIGINRPSIIASRTDHFALTFLNNQAMATSGNYRSYYELDGKMIAHTINPKTGYSEVRNLLSATIFASNCTLADAYATACMVKGVDRSIEMIEKINGVEGFLIFSNDNGALEYYTSHGALKQIEVLD